MVGRPARVAIADRNQQHRLHMAQIVSGLELEVACLLCDGRDLVEACRSSSIDLVITDTDLSHMGGLDALREINSRRPVPAIVLSAEDNEDIAQRVRIEPVAIFALLVKPVRRLDLEGAIHLALSLSQRLSALQLALDASEKQLAERKVIERAKGILMDWIHLRESEAHRRLQKIARDKNCRVAEVAQWIVNLQCSRPHLDAASLEHFARPL